MPVPMRSLPPRGPPSQGASALRTSLPVNRTQSWMPVSRQKEIRACSPPARWESSVALSLIFVCSELWVSCILYPFHFVTEGSARCVDLLPLGRLPQPAHSATPPTSLPQPVT